MSQDEQLLNELKQVVLDNLENEQFSVEQLSQSVGVSRSHLHRKLKKLKGQSISQFIREIRLAEALKLLRRDEATASEIAYKVGFNSPSYFHKCFQEYYGYPPSEGKEKFQALPLGEETTGETIADTTIEIKPSIKKSAVNFKTIAFSIIAFIFLAYSAFYFLKKDTPVRSLEKSIAVLPFNNLSEDESNQHFADGLVEDLLNRLALVKDFKVISRTSSDTYRERGIKKATEIAKELGVSYIVEGSVQKQNNRTRITVQLIDAINDEHVWTKTFDKNLADIFKIQSEVAVLVASELKAELTEQQTFAIQKNRTDNPKAFELYQLGRHHWGKRTDEGLQASINYFEQAIAEDSSYALAYAGMADTYYLKCWFDDADKRKSNRGKAIELAKKALELDNRLTEAYTVLATVYAFVDWNWATAEKVFLQGFEHNANFSNIHHRYSEHLSITGRHEAARMHINKGLELDPLSYIVRYVSAKLYYNRGLFKESKAEIQICNDLILNKFHWYTHDASFEINCHLGNVTAVVENLKAVEEKYGVETNSGKVDSIYNASGLKGLMKYRAEIEIDPFYKARFWGLCDDGKAMDWLEKAFEDRKIEVVMPYMYNFRNLHSNPRFIALLEKMNLPWSPDATQ